MRINGKTVTPPPKELLVLPREDGPIAFWAEPADLEDFFKLCPFPAPPGKLVPNQGWVPDPEDKGYQSVVASHAAQRTAYTIVFSLKPSNIEWDAVNLDNPKTWDNWNNDLTNAQFTDAEIDRIVQLVVDANGLNEAKLQRAREDFLAGRAQMQNPISFPSTEQASTPSGEPVNASE